VAGFHHGDTPDNGGRTCQLGQQRLNNKLRHYCASQLYLSGVGLLAIQELLGHAWVVTTMRYVHVNSSHVEDAWQSAAVRRGGSLEGLLR
jgi:site-specific recombinase XerD